MARTEEQDQQDMEAYAQAFGEDMKQTDAPDEFADASTDAVAQEEAEAVTTEPEVAEPVAAEGDPMEAPPEEAPAEKAPVEAVAEESAPMAESGTDDVPPEDMQRFKSWEGRMKKREAELAAREAALAGGEEPESGEIQIEESIEAEAGAGEDDAIARVRADFGDDFVEAIISIVSKVASGKAEELIGSKSQEVQEAINSLQSRYEENDTSEHFGYILDKHPDFFETIETGEFKQWVGDKPDMQECCEHGSRRAVAKMLSAFKESQQEVENDEGLDDLVAVQSSGLVIPEKKRKQGDFEGAWDEF